MSPARETTLTFFFVMWLSPLKPKSCVLHNFDTLRHILIIFGRGIGNDQQVCHITHMQERQPLLWLFSSYLP